MRRFTCLVALMILIFIAGFASIHFTIAQNSPVILYSTSNGIIQFSLDTQQAELIYSMNNAGDYLFSNSGRYITFRDNDTLWLTEINDWNPVQVISITQQGLYHRYWTPDDTRFVFEIGSLPQPCGQMVCPTPDDVEWQAFNTVTGELETWLWAECRNNFVRHQETNELALVCQSIDSAESSAIALSWGGDFATYNPSIYLNVMPDVNFDDEAWIITSYNWQPVNGTDQVIFNRNIDENFITRQIFVSTPELSQVTYEANDFDTSPWAVSHGGNYTALVVRPCNNYGRVSCLRIIDTFSGETLFETSETFATDGHTERTPLVTDLDWYFDNSHIIATVWDITEQISRLYIFDLESRLTQIVDLPDSIQTIVLSE